MSTNRLCRSLLPLLAVVMTVLSLMASNSTRALAQSDAVTILHPEAGSLSLPSFQVKIRADGSVYASGSGLLRPGDSPAAYKIQFNIRQKTYRISRANPKEVPSHFPQKIYSQENSSLATSRPQNGSVGIQAVAPGDYVNLARVVTRDPALIHLAETQSELTWRVYSNNTVNWIRVGDICWAANPSSVGTHWFISSCSNSPAWFSAPYAVNNEAKGSFFNWDFGSSTQKTTVSQTVNVQGRSDGTAAYTWSWSAGGEASWLLTAYLATA